jgi:hypothetical protein
MKKERGREGEKEPTSPLLKTLEDILHNKIKQKKEKRHFPLNLLVYHNSL